ncbi:MAG: transposase, partial [Phormidesmis sp. RL_2_1]|nr:transposase [Phormidesmis sp. RL_2_1]
MGIDEISKRKGYQQFATVVSDLEAGQLIEVIDSHAQEDVIEVLKQQPLQVREQVIEVSVDMWGGFPKVVREVFPNAKLVVDRFHVMQALTKELNTIRKQTRVTEKGARFLILKNREDLEEADKQKSDQILKRSRRLRKAYELKESFR